MIKTAYCENCCEDTEFGIQHEMVNVDLKGVRFSYIALVPNCVKCHSEVHVPEVNDLNIIRAYTAQKNALEKDG